MIKLLIKRRTADWHVSLEGHPEVWDCGETLYRAIGRWIMAHGEDYGVKTEMAMPAVFPNVGNPNLVAFVG